eukprot:scpid91720/ scgid33729/ 
MVHVVPLLFFQDKCPAPLGSFSLAARQLAHFASGFWQHSCCAACTAAARRHLQCRPVVRLSFPLLLRRAQPTPELDMNTRTRQRWAHQTWSAEPTSALPIISSRAPWREGSKVMLVRQNSTFKTTCEAYRIVDGDVHVSDAVLIPSEAYDIVDETEQPEYDVVRL